MSFLNDFMLKGVIIMTLAELAKAAKVSDFLIPSVLKDLEVENSEQFCRCRVARYLKSVDFKDDAITILDLLVKTSVPLEEFTLQFYEDDCKNLRLRAFGGLVESL